MYVYRHLDCEIFIITSSEFPIEFQDGVTILLLSTDQEPVLTFINRGKEAIDGKAILQHSSKLQVVASIRKSGYLHETESFHHFPPIL